MRTLDRKGAKESQQEFEPHMSQQQLDSMRSKLQHLKAVSRPRAIEQTREYAQNGDFSENAEYQIAKGRLRGINRAITELEYQIPRVIVIEAPSTADVIHMGHTVTVQVGPRKFKWQILGPKESDPSKQIISHKSPIGQALLGKRIGETAIVELPSGQVSYTICDIQ